MEAIFCAIMDSEGLEALLPTSILATIDEESGYTPITYAVYNGKISALKLMFKHNGDPNHTDGNGDTPLFAALARNYPTATKCLLEHKADPNDSGSENCYPLSYAVEYCDPSIVKMLLEAGADPEHKRQGFVTPIQFATNSLKKSPGSRHWIKMVSLFTQKTTSW